MGARSMEKQPVEERKSSSKRGKGKFEKREICSNRRLGNGFGAKDSRLFSLDCLIEKMPEHVIPPTKADLENILQDSIRIEKKGKHE